MRTWLVVLLGLTAICQAAMLPSATVPDGLGINIHFTGEPARDLDLIQAGGFRLVRMDLSWEAVERTRGVYTFDAYDQLTAGLKKRGIRPIFGLQYGNKLYEQQEYAVATDAGRQAFARFAAAAAARYRGQGVIWELWNEPNFDNFWKPKPSVDAYMQLAKVALPAVRAADPTATIIAPALATIDLPFLEGCCKQGLLELVDAVSVHPYRQTMPETVEEDIQRLRVLIARYAPDKPNLPIVDGEWGYSAVWAGFNEARQGQYMARQMLTNLSLGLPLSIWYDWHDKGLNPSDPELYFGVISIDYQPKPNYLALQRLTLALGGMHFVKRLVSSPEDYLLLFSDNTHWTLAAWTTGAAHPTTLWPGQFLTLSGDPLYLSVPATAKEMRAEGAWTATPASFGITSGTHATRLAPAVTVRVRNPFHRAVAVKIDIPAQENLVGRLSDAAPFVLQPGATALRQWSAGYPPRRDRDAAVTLAVSVDGVTRRQTVRFQPVNPVVLHTVDMDARHMGVQVAIPTDEPFDGVLMMYPDAQKTAVRLQVHPATREITATYKDRVLPCIHTNGGVVVSFPEEVDWAHQPVGFTLSEGAALVADSGTAHMRPLEVTTKTATALNDGDGNVRATFTLEDLQSPPEAPVTTAIRLNYDFADGWKFVRIAPPALVPLDGKPRAIGVWVYGNQSLGYMCTRVTDATGRIYQPVFGQLDFTGWRFLTAPLDDPTVYHWGGVDTTTGITYPLSVNTFVCVDSTKKAVKDTVTFAGFQVMY